MAEKRMFSKKVTDSDAFIELSSSAQALYFHLNQNADDDGFNNQVQMAMYKSHACVDDLKVLMAKKFIIRFESGVIVIKHWRIHNTLRKDRYTPTNFQDELSQLHIKNNGSYTLEEIQCGCQAVAKGLPQYSIDKNSIDKNSKDIYTPTETAAVKTKHKYGEYKHVLLTDKEIDTLNHDYGQAETEKAIKYLDEYIEMKGSKYKSHYLVMKKWVYEAVKQHKTNVKKTGFSNFTQRDVEIDESQFINN